jgi:hypothetical protein
MHIVNKEQRYKPEGPIFQSFLNTRPIIKQKNKNPYKIRVN